MIWVLVIVILVAVVHIVVALHSKTGKVAQISDERELHFEVCGEFEIGTISQSNI